MEIKFGNEVKIIGVEENQHQPRREEISCYVRIIEYAIDTERTRSEKQRIQQKNTSRQQMYDKIL